MDLNKLGILIGILSLVVGFIFWLVPKEALTNKFKKYSISDRVESLNLRQEFKIAIVDDEMNSYPLKYLKELGYTVKEYDSVSFADSTELIKNDLLLLDVKGVVKEDLDEGGAKLIKIIKESRPLLPVVAVSSGYFHPELNDYFKSSDATLNKPIDEYRIRELFNELKKEFFDINCITMTIESAIRKLELSKSKKNLFNKYVIDFVINDCKEVEFLDFVHQNAKGESQSIIDNSRILLDRIKNA